MGCHARADPSLLGAEGRRWAQRKKTPLVFTWHSIYDRYTHYVPLGHSLAGAVAMRHAARFAQKRDHVIAPTQSVVDVMRAAGVTHDRISVIASPGMPRSLQMLMVLQSARTMALQIRQWYL